MKKTSLSGKKVVVGVTAGIAAYKSCELVRLLVTEGAQVKVVMTQGATRFVTPLTFQALSNHPVGTDIFDLTQESEMGHIQLADEADLIVIAPATADFIAKAAHGLCDDLLSTLLLVTRAPLLMAPAMNVNMYQNAVTQENIQKLKNRGVHFIGPESGDLACGWNGLGRLSDPQKIVEQIKLVIPA